MVQMRFQRGRRTFNFKSCRGYEIRALKILKLDKYARVVEEYE
jgi:hypothetical protein